MLYVLENNDDKTTKLFASHLVSSLRKKVDPILGGDRRGAGGQLQLGGRQLLLATNQLELGATCQLDATLGSTQPVVAYLPF